jgi:hypothetical protein
LNFSLISAFQHFPQLTDLDEASMVNVEVFESFTERLAKIDLAFIVHSDDELIEIDFAGVVDVHGLYYVLNLVVGVPISTQLCFEDVH